MSKKVALYVDDAIRIFNPDSILYFSQVKNNCNVNLYDGTSEAIPLKMEVLEAAFPSFFRINPNNLINLSFLSHISEHGQGYVIIDQHLKLPIDQDRKLLLFETLKQFI